MDDEILNSDTCMETVIKFYSNLVYKLAFARSGNKFDADEIYQEVFIRYIKKQPLFSSEDHRKAWFIKVTINYSKKYWNLAWFRKTQRLEESMQFTSEEDNNLYSELLKLSPKYREIIHLFYYEGYTTEEISQLLGRKNSTIRVQLMRARSMLKEFLKEEDNV